MPYFPPDPWKSEPMPPPSSENLSQSLDEPWSFETDHTCLFVAMPLEPEPPDRAKKEIQECCEDRVPYIFNEYPWNKQLWWITERTRSLFDHTGGAHYTHETLWEPQFGNLMYGIPPILVIFFVEFLLLNYKRCK